MSIVIFLLIFAVLPILSEKVYFIESSSNEKSSSNGQNTNNPNNKYESTHNYNSQNNQNINQNTQHRYGSESEDTRIKRILSNGVNSLTLAIDNELAIGHSRNNYGQEQNILFSPVSITGALALLLLGAGGKTFQEIAALMRTHYGFDVSSNSQVIHNQFGKLLNDLDQRSPYYIGPHISFASGIFVQNNFPIRDQYKQASTNIYRSEIFNMDFQNDGNRAQNQINRWVSGLTHGKINDIIPSIPPPNTRMIIVSALYFKGEWEYHFMAEATRRRPFYPYGVKNGRSVMVNMMVNGGEFMYFHDNQLDCQIIALPYKGNNSNMYIIIPNNSSIDKLRSFESYLTSDHIERLISNMRLTEMIIVMPKMTLSSTISLKNVLYNLGIKSLFNPQEANLALISEKNTGTSNPTRKQEDYSSHQTHNIKGQTPVNQIRQTTSAYKEEKNQDVYQSSVGQQIYQPQPVLSYEVNIQPSYQPEILPVYPRPGTQVSYNQQSNQNKQTTTTSRNNVYQNPVVYTQSPVHNQHSGQQAYHTTTVSPLYQENKPQSILIYQNPVVQPASISQFNQRPVQTIHQTTTQRYQVRETNTPSVYYQENKPQSANVNQYPVQEQVFQQFIQQLIPTTQSYYTTQKPTAEYPIVFIQDMNRNDNKKCTDTFSNDCSGFDEVQQGNTHKKYATQNNQRGRRSVQKRQNNIVSKQQQIDNVEQLRQYLNSQNERDYNPGLYADEILHKVFIDVSETGTEAAAATAVSISRDGGKITLKVNVPFLFFIREENTKLNMFWGSVNVPTPHFN